MIKDAAYWISLAHIPKWGYLKINNLIIKFYHENQLTIEEFFNLDETQWKNVYQLSSDDISDLKKAKSEIASNAFLAESLFNQGYELIPIISTEYSKTLKQNLKATYAPSLLYIKGNQKILNEKSIAIVGSRSASDISLQFADNIAKIASERYKVIVSGFAKGVDKQALDSAIKYRGQSIIVLPQGIMTFGSGYKTYYKQILSGDVLVLSTFFPKSPWSTALAMARNPIIYGLADEIYVAESAEKGGTWSGVIDGLKKKRKIFVRKPDINEINANSLLISKGAVAVDYDGAELSSSSIDESTPYIEPEKNEVEAINHSERTPIIEEPDGEYSERSLEEKIKQALRSKPLNKKEIMTNLKIDDKQKKFIEFLKKLPFIEIIKKGSSNYYKLKNESIRIDSIQKDLF